MRNLVTVLLLIPTLLSAQQKITDLYPSQPKNYVTDMANILNNEESLNIKLKYMRDSLKVGMAVVTLPTIGRYQASEVALSIGRTWGVADTGQIGSISRNAGMVLLIVPKTLEHKGECRLETARGVEGYITDSYAGALCREMINYFKQSNYSDGISYGVAQIYGKVEQNVRPVLETTPNSIKTESNSFLTIIILFLFATTVVICYLIWRARKLEHEYSPVYVPSIPKVNRPIARSSTIYRPTTRYTPPAQTRKQVDDAPSIPYVPPPIIQSSNDDDSHHRSSTYDPPSSTPDFGGFSGGDGFSGGGGGDSW